MARFSALLLATALMAADYDVLIRDARIADGTGNPWFRASIGIRGGRIAAIGTLPGATADRLIDAQGRVAAPGFIDVHTHVEANAEKIPRADNFLLDGVTTIVTGNCGSSKDKLGEWFARLESLGLGVNLASLVGHNTVRAAVMGTANRIATAEELARMEQLVAAAMKDGAVGLSTGLEYVPGAYSNPAEVAALAKAAARHGGIYASHMRDEGARIAEAIAEAVEAGRAANTRVQISHFKIDTPRLWGATKDSLALVERYRREGVDVVVDLYPYDHTSTNLGITLPNWALADGRAAIADRLRTPAARARIAGEMHEMLQASGHKDYSYATVADFPQDPSLEGKTISEINAARGRERTVANEIETILDILAVGRPSMVFHSMSMEDVERIMRHPHTAIASDGGIREFGSGVPHPRSYGTNARVLGEFVRKRRTLTLEDAVRRMTSLPARTFAFADRGLLREGMAADVVVFDPARVEDKATYAKPHHYAAGFDFVLVNGVMMVDQGKLTENKGGRVLRSRAYTQ